MIAIRKRPGEAAELIEIENKLSALQKEVGGYIQAINIAEDAAIICDEEGRLKGYEHNCEVLSIDFCGTILVVGVDGENFCSLKEPEQTRKVIFGKYDIPECLELVCRDDGKWEVYENYATIECETKEDFDRLTELVKKGESLEWRKEEDELPSDEEIAAHRKKYNGEDPMYLVMIKDAELPAALYFNGDIWYDENDMAYRVTHWMPMPEAPEKERA